MLRQQMQQMAQLNQNMGGEEMYQNNYVGDENMDMDGEMDQVEQQVEVVENQQQEVVQ